MITCKSDLKFIKKLDLGKVEINKLPQLYRADMEFARSLGNAELNQILDEFKISGKYKHVSIDTRSHMLMTGMYPCIPGWHCDDFYRTDELNQQPDLANVDDAAPAIHHLLVLGDCSRTEFIKEDIYIPPVEIIQQAVGTNAPIYKWCDELIDGMQFKTRIKVDPGSIYTFGPTAFHRGTAATHNGWRCFIRITESNHRYPKNEIRYQTQVYTDGRVSW